MGTFSDSGYVRTRLTAWQTALKDLYYSIFGTNIDLSDDTQDGQLIGTFAEALSNQDQQVELISKVCDPAQAQGSYLSTLVALNGVTRQEETYSTVTLTLTGTDGTVIPLGSIMATTSGDQFTTDNAVTIASGTATVTATASESGPISAVAGSLTEMVTVIAGLSSVTNSNDASVGQDEESDTDLRVRRRASVALASTGNVQSVYGALLSLDDVEDVVVKENATASVDSDGISAHSIACIIEGGTAADIAETINLTKSAGCVLYGDLTETIVDSQGFDKIITYSRPEDVDIYIDIAVTGLSTFPDDGSDQIKAAIIDYFETDSETKQAIGEDLIYSEIYTPVNSVDGVSVTSLWVGLAADVPLDSGNMGTIYIAFDEIARFDTSRITITVS